jgi:hypothetical protein
MPLREVEVPYEGVMDQCLQYDAHKARLAHVVEPSQTNRSAR